jgi:isoleucyl-tRNA synthetase
VTGALEIERAAKRIGSSLEAAPIIHVSNLAAYKDFVAHNVDFAELCITSAVTLVAGDGPADAFRLPSIPDIAVVPGRAEGRKCARSWRITTDVGSDPAYPELSARDAAAMREIEAA